MTRRRRKYTLAERDELVSAVRAGEKTAAEVAGELCVDEGTVERWLTRARTSPEPTERDVARAQLELKRLRREHLELLEEVEILRKAQAFFADDGGRL